MDSNINDLKNAINVKHKQLGVINNEILELERQVHEYGIQCNQKAINYVYQSFHLVKEIIEKWGSFKFDGFHLSRNNNNLLIFVSNKDNEIYNIIIENGEFVFAGDIDELIESEFMKKIIIELNE